MKKTCLALGLALAACGSASAALDVGDRAPNFSIPAALGGQVFTFSLQESLAKGPVVLYFFPLAFSEGCSLEAHQFAEATAQFQALGASVVGVSTDDIDTLSKFSTQACQSKFPVASDESKKVVTSYDAVWRSRPEWANRISYVIAPNGSVVYNYVNLNPERHVEKTLAALKDWAAAKAAAATTTK
ncbi:MAG TPA: peroxiredoxin [Burkholderiaceae bacterium]|nr:peroxiredoxin [Burkholderiaceae bacterium]